MGCGPVKRSLVALILSFGMLSSCAAGAQEATPSRPKVLILYSLNVENRSRSLRAGRTALLRSPRPEGQLLAGSNDQLGRSQRYESEVRTKLVVWLNEFPHNQAEREAFERYMTGGGAWLGFHVSAYNDKTTKVAMVYDIHRRRRL